jgi:hypothetical protein
MNDQAIEQEIQAKGKTAPRVTPADIEANIAHEVYFVAADAVRFAYLTSDPADHEQRERKNSIIDSLPTRSYSGACIDIDANTHVPASLPLLTFCVLVLRNGFTVTGESACASPDNFDAEIGRNIARQNAVQKIWPLMGYQLRDELHRRAQFDASPKTSEESRMQKHIDMVRESGWAPGDGDGRQDDDVHVAARAAEVRKSEVHDRAPSRYETLPPSRQARAANLPAHQKRVIDEKRELDERKEKLEAFFDTPKFAQLDADEQGRLHAQRGAMAAYARILSERISAFAGEHAVLDASSSR